MGENNKEIRIPEVYLKKIEEAIGAKILLEEQGRFSSFLEIDDPTKERAKEIYEKVDEIRAISYLKFVLAKDIDRSKIFSFLFDVVIGGMDPNVWAKEELGSPE